MPEEFIQLENQDSPARTRREPLEITYLENTESLPPIQQQPLIFIRKTDKGIYINNQQV